jgi:hypothetical protein
MNAVPKKTVTTRSIFRQQYEKKENANEKGNVVARGGDSGHGLRNHRQR